MQTSFGNARNKAEQFAAATKNISVGAQQAGKAAEKAAPKIGGFVSSIARIAKYRMIRAVIRAIVNAIKEGTENFYNFSKAAGAPFAAAMDSVKSKAQTMKNQLGAAFGTLFTNIAPIINNLISLITKLANAITMLFARLGGAEGWYRAADGANATADAVSGAGSAAKKAMKYLAPFDELNRMSDSNSGGGGGGDSSGGGGNYEWVEFENLDIGAGLQELVGKIRDAFNNAAEWIENIDWANIGHELYDKLVWAITEIDWSGLAASFFRMFGAALGGASAVIAAFVSDLWADIKTYFLQFIDADGDGTWCGEDIVRGIFQGVGNAMKNVFNWVKEYIFTPFINGFKAAFGIASPAKEMEEPGEMIALGILDGIAKPFKAIGEWIKTNVLDKFKEAFGESGVLDLSVKIDLPQTALTAIDNLKKKWDSIKNKTASLKTKYSGIKETALNTLASKWSVINTKAATLTANLKNNVNTAVITPLKQAWDSLKDKKATLTASLGANKVVQTFVTAWNNLKDKTLELKVGINDKIKTTWNAVAQKWNANSILSKLGTLPYLAQGGMLNAGQIFVARESGPEIVGSFGNKTGVMNNEQIVTAVANGIARVLSDMKFSVSSSQSYSYGGANEETMYRAMLRALNAHNPDGNVSVSIDMDGQQIYNGIVSRNRKEIFRTGVNPMMARG